MSDVYAQIGAKDEALRWLRHAVEIGFFQPDFLASWNQHLVGLRDEPEFKAIVKEAHVGAAKMRTTVEEKVRRLG